MINPHVYAATLLISYLLALLTHRIPWLSRKAHRLRRKLYKKNIAKYLEGRANPFLLTWPLHTELYLPCAGILIGINIVIMLPLDGDRSPHFIHRSHQSAWRGFGEPGSTLLRLPWAWCHRNCNGCTLLFRFQRFLVLSSAWYSGESRYTASVRERLNRSFSTNLIL